MNKYAKFFITSSTQYNEEIMNKTMDRQRIEIDYAYVIANVIRDILQDTINKMKRYEKLIPLDEIKIWNELKDINFYSLKEYFLKEYVNKIDIHGIVINEEGDYMIEVTNKITNIKQHSNGCVRI